MINNLARAADVMADYADEEGGLAYIDNHYDGDCTGLAEALADAGLLAPDLPEPDDVKDFTDWETGPITVSYDGKNAHVITNKNWAEFPAEHAEAVGLALLAVAKHAEKEVQGMRTKITCQEREDYLRDMSLRVGSALTDPMGKRGRPLIETEWWKDDKPFMLDILECEPTDEFNYMYDIKKCRHYLLTAAKQAEKEGRE